MLIFEGFLPLKRPLVTTICEAFVLTSWKYVAEDTKSNPKQLKPYELHWVYSPIFVIKF